MTICKLYKHSHRLITSNSNKEYFLGVESEKYHFLGIGKAEDLDLIVLIYKEVWPIINQDLIF
jgi:hypothetical protein